MLLKLICFNLVVACAVASGLKAKPRMTTATEHTQNIMDLDASQSKGNIASYQWKLLNSPFVNHTIAGHAKALFKTTAGGVFDWELTVCTANQTKCRSKVIKSPEFLEITDMSAEKRLDGPHAVARMSVSKQGTDYDMDLYANRSTDDKGIKSYEWRMVEGDNVGLTYTTAQASYITKNPSVYKWELKVCDTDDLCSMSAVVVDATFE